MSFVKYLSVHQNGSKSLFSRCNEVKKSGHLLCLKKQVYSYSSHLMHSFLLPFQIGGLWKLRATAATICNERCRCLTCIFRYIPVLRLSPISNALVTPGLIVDIIRQVCGDAELLPGSGGRRSLERLTMALYLVRPSLRSENANFEDHDCPLPLLLHPIALRSMNRAK